MRANLPVSQREYAFPGDETLLSTTDTQSHITYANAAFVRTSGYGPEELAGQPHNLVRHPDMPQEAFADMWRSLKQGQSWTALVKNRRKNGDHYWVRANAAPMRRNGQVVGFLSVRTKPTREEVAASETLYARFQKGHAKALAFHRGLIVRTGLARWTSAPQLLPVAWRVRLPLLLSGAVIVATVGAFGLGVGTVQGVAAVVVASLLVTDAVIENQLSTPLKRVLKVAEQVASGEPGEDLALNRCDEIGLLSRAIRQSGLNLQSLVADVHEQVSGVRVASQQIAAANQDLSSRTAQTVAKLEETAAIMVQQTLTVGRNAQTAIEASKAAQVATQVAAQGGNAMGNVVSTMDLISESSRRIADIISVIDGIAFQTNILALNAAVEAARAGEQGRGFAVVASEVRSLAGRSSAAAKEIKTLIEDSVLKVESGSHLVADAGKTMSDVVAQVQRVNDLLTEISTASREQNLEISQVGDVMASLEEAARQNATMVEQSSAATSSMSEQAQLLLDAVRVFSHATVHAN